MDPARGMVVNSSALIAHSRLLTEMAMRVAKIPQLKNYHGGINDRVPQIFKSAAVLHAVPRTTPTRNAIPPSDHDDSIESRTQAAEREQGPLSALADRQEAEGASNDPQIIGVSPGSPQLNASVARPDAATAVAPVPGPGISTKTVIDDEKTPFHYLGWSYDMNVIALSYWMMDRFAFDCEELLKFYKQKFPNVFTGTVAEELAKLPCMTTRFCHYLDTKCTIGGAVLPVREHCKPLLYTMNTKTSFYKDSNPEQTRTARELEAVRRHVSEVNGRDLDVNSPEVQQHLGARGRNRVVQGTRENLYSFKCWWNHALFALQQSGGIESEQDPMAYVILDSACAFRLRVRQDAAINGGDDEDSCEMKALLQPPKYENRQNITQEVVESNKRTREFAQAVQDSRMQQMLAQGADPTVFSGRVKKKRAEAQSAQAAPNASAIPVGSEAGPSGSAAQGAGC